MEKRLQELLEDQVNKELWSAYLYLDIAEFYRAKGFDGLHSWFEHQAQEEIEHAEKFIGIVCCSLHRNHSCSMFRGIAIQQGGVEHQMKLLRNQF